MLDILPMQVNQRTPFAEIWIPWLRDTMKRTPEPENLAVMADPAVYYRAHGGEVFLAILDGEVVSAVAVKKLDEAGFEFCKLVVSEKARGQGAGAHYWNVVLVSLPTEVDPPFFFNHSMRSMSHSDFTAAWALSTRRRRPLCRCWPERK